MARSPKESASGKASGGAPSSDAKVTAKAKADKQESKLENKAKDASTAKSGNLKAPAAARKRGSGWKRLVVFLLVIAAGAFLLIPRIAPDLPSPWRERLAGISAMIGAISLPAIGLPEFGGPVVVVDSEQDEGGDQAEIPASTDEPTIEGSSDGTSAETLIAEANGGSGESEDEGADISESASEDAGETIAVTGSESEADSTSEGEDGVDAGDGASGDVAIADADAASDADGDADMGEGAEPQDEALAGDSQDDGETAASEADAQGEDDPIADDQAEGDQGEESQGESDLAASDGDADSASEASLEELSAENATLKDELEKLQADLAKAVDAREEEEQRAQDLAEQAANNARQQSAINALRLAIIQGRALDAPLGALQEAGIDAANLEELSSYDATSASLSQEFGSYAHEAIRASKSAAAGGGLIAGLRGQIEAEFVGRSLEPIEGTTPDAVLSRAEAALREGDLAKSLADIATLPSEAQDALAPWVEKAKAQLLVLEKIDALGRAPE